jgi:hypothetical protein
MRNSRRILASLALITITLPCSTRILAQSHERLQQPQSQLQSQPPSAISLVGSPETNSPAANRNVGIWGTSKKNAVAPHRAFDHITLGQSSPPQLFTLEFHQTTTLTNVEGTPDFKITGGSCIEGHTYISGDRCSIDMVFTPQGPGHRIGRLTVKHTASAQPFVTTTGGEAYGPVVSFIPAQITTLPGTYISSTQPGASHGLLLAPQSLSVDGGDNLYIADTGNNLIRYMDSSGVITILAGGGTNSAANFFGPPTGVRLNAPYAAAADQLGTVWISDTGNSVVRTVPTFGSIQTSMGAGSSTNPCTLSAPCSPYNEAFSPFTGLAFDPYGNLFLNLSIGSTGEGPGELFAATGDFANLNNTTLSDSTSTFPLAVDQNDSLFYTFEYVSQAAPYVNVCNIVGESYSQATGSSGAKNTLVGGSRTCGFSGDGGPATGAQISGSVQGLALDEAGNLYFSDSGNNRIRRIDATTGIIRTIAGNGVAGFLGDGGPATGAAIDSPYGVAVDSRGRVYATALIPNSSTGPQPAIVRQIGPTGQISFPAQAVSTRSALQTILVSNTGNAALNFTSFALTSGNTSDFVIDPISSTCTTRVPLFSGASCQIGVYFTPTTTGARAALMTLYDDTVSNSNIVQLTGAGAASNPAQAVLSPTSETFGAQTVGASSAPQPVTLSNPGGATLNINSITIIGANPGDFTQTSTCGTTLTAGANCSIGIVFRPTATGARSATLSVATSVGNPTVALSGSGTAAVTATISPTSFAFSSQTVGTSSSIQPFTVTNTGTSTLTFNSYGFTGTNATDFITAHSCAATLAAAATCTVNVVFKPAAAGARSANLVVGTTAGTLTVPLTGTAVAAAAKPNVTLTSGANPVPVGKSLKLISRIALALPNRINGSEPAAPLPTGTVQLMEGATVLAEAELSNGIAAFNLSDLSAGTHMLTANYLGDSQHRGSQSNLLKQIVGFNSTMPHR